MIFIKDYRQLVNQSWLYLKQHPMQKINVAEISRSVGLNRATVQKELNQFDDYADLEIKNFYEDCDNKYDRAIKIIEDLEPEVRYTQREYAEMLGVSEYCIGHCRDWSRGNVYACFYEGELLAFTLADSVEKDRELLEYVDRFQLEPRFIVFEVLAQGVGKNFAKNLKRNLERVFVTLIEEGGELCEV